MFFVFLLILFFSIKTPSLAQSNTSLIGVTPAILEQVVTPNSRKEFNVFVYNLSPNPLPIKSSVQKLQPNEEITSDNDEIFNSQKWISVYPQEYILKPQERKEIKIIINTPKKVEPGGHYATIFFEPLVSKSNSNAQHVNISTKVGLLTFLIVKGEIVKQSEVSQFATKKFWQFSPIEFNLKIKNTGNIHFIPDDQLVIKNYKNKVIDLVKIPTTLILPQTEKRLLLNWHKKNIFGYYSAHLKSNPNKEIFFWIIPWIYIAVFILLTSFVIYLTINYKKLKQAIRILLNKN